MWWLAFLLAAQPVVDAHNCYPYEGKYADRIERALKAGAPVSIEQDLAWSEGRVVLSHSAKPKGGEPDLETYFFARVAPVVREALEKNDKSKWPVLYLHFDFKDNRRELLEAVAKILASHEDWLTTAVKPANASEVTPLDLRPVMALTEESDEQAAVFYESVPVGGKLRVFGSAKNKPLPGGLTIEERNELLVKRTPEEMLAAPPDAYRRWWNNSWFAVETGGARQAGEWTAEDGARLKALVDRAHKLGYWIRFYCLDGFTAEEDRGWDPGYNFGSLEAVRKRWKAAKDAGVEFIATDQYEELGRAVR
jgi:hypothetical protein